WNTYNALTNSACSGWPDIYYYSGANCTGTDIGGTYYYTGAPLWSASGASATTFAYQSEYYSTYNGISCSMACLNTTGSVGNVFLCQPGYTQTTVQYGVDSNSHPLYMVSCVHQ
ncbi:MAG TPA: hypothetical protein VMU70_01210, partial [Candidatus Tyrphobacter sp.]|nr:hypothetical protein [Candidatus Tyrphobacter sp.]